ncbi:cell envelope integrity protein TolA [Vibrio marisflavi]|uniref:Uncharacterized protein n=1 Tax=Vibrio marisflavi CECT 7928 TaxID=634439 RepID=A0ABM9A859_9VIBR|nr:cell envelope integrity protein TolA [Vibrio marisflavi]CAH0540941.1 hypothetical protein VMF7928_03245 [Vibrio marisflavi CECT 7928]
MGIQSRISFRRFFPTTQQAPSRAQIKRSSLPILLAVTVLSLGGCAHNPAPKSAQKSEVATSVQNGAEQKIEGNNGVPQQVQSAANIIRQSIEKNLYVPNSAVGKLSTEVRLQLNKETQLTSVKIVRSSGNTEFDNRVKMAVYNSFPIAAIAPLNEKQYHFLKEIDLTVKPEK